MDNLFKEQLTKHNVELNILNKAACINIPRIEYLYNIDCFSLSSNTGLLCINIDNLFSECFVYIDDKLIFKLKSAGNRFVPINFEKNFVLKIEGSAVGITLMMIGACFAYNQKTICIPNSNSVICGVAKEEFRYDSCQNLIEDNVNFIESHSNALCVQTVIIPTGYDLGKVIIDDAVYFCKKSDNYTSKIFLSNSASDAIFVQNDVDGRLSFFLLDGGNIVQKQLDNNVVLDDETRLSFSDRCIPVKFESSVVIARSSKVFGLKMSNGKYYIYILKPSSQIEKILEIKAENIKIIERDDSVDVVIFDGINIRINKYSLNISNDYLNIASLIESKSYKNVIDVLITSDDYILVYSSGCKCVLNG